MSYVPRISPKQRWILNLLSAQPVTTRTLVEGRQFVDPYTSWDEIHSLLRRLENREFVRRIEFNPNVWQVTEAGRKIIE